MNERESLSMLLTHVEKHLAASDNRRLLEPACPSSEIGSLQAATRLQLHAELPDGYASLLAMTDGLLVGDIEFFASRRRRAKFAAIDDDFNDPWVSIGGFLDENTSRRADDDWFAGYLLVGESESSLLAMDVRSSRWQDIDVVGRDVMREYHSFAELAWYTAMLRINLPPFPKG
jgi:hypothetical protein